MFSAIILPHQTVSKMSRCIGLLCCLVSLLYFPFVGQAQDVLRNGGIVFERADNEQEAYFFEITRDTTDSTLWTSVRHGLDESGPALVLPSSVVRKLNEQLMEAAPLDSARIERMAVSFEEGFFSLSLAQHLDLSWVLFLCLVFVMFIGLLLFWFKRRLRQEKQRQTELEWSRKGMSEKVEDERLRLARELHDGPVQDLHAVRMQLTMMTSAPGPMQDHHGVGVDGLQDELLGVINELRSISEDLRPPALGPFGLAAAVDAFVERYKRLHPGIQVHLDLDDDGQRLPERVRLALFRICQEALNNAAQHAKAESVTVQFRLTEEQIMLTICDDGQGFKLPREWVRLTQEGHFGLQGMKERADAMGAHLSIESEAGQGTCVHLTASIYGQRWETMHRANMPV